MANLRELQERLQRSANSRLRTILDPEDAELLAEMIRKQEQYKAAYQNLRNAADTLVEP